ncbi:hypothetical protein DFR69_11381 [Nocardia neocaledoniensis]|uniref:Uncharacterized protein n=1 Tax=Nocardia neocaledoniensis TaxID=236511 RepID=A0A317N9T3_9NOCA|nr:hypothetical protein [Nocardia neocaledoniensis]PWV70368.1 hypothetical protein DFR69_11381 [Nocardia neocaledoniensis]
MLITALVLALAGFLRRGRGRRADTATAPRAPRVGRVVAAVRRGAVRLVREPMPALSAAVAVFGLAIVGTHLLCAGPA